MKTQLQHFYCAQQKESAKNKTFLFLVENGLSSEELKKLIEKRPSLWGGYSGWVPRLPQKEI